MCKIMVDLPDEIVDKIMLYYSTPSADIIKTYIKWLDEHYYRYSKNLILKGCKKRRIVRRKKITSSSF